MSRWPSGVTVALVGSPRCGELQAATTTTTPAKRMTFVIGAAHDEQSLFAGSRNRSLAVTYVSRRRATRTRGQRERCARAADRRGARRQRSWVASARPWLRRCSLRSRDVGPRCEPAAWLGATVRLYHRTIEDHVAALQSAGFSLQQLRESRPRREHN